MRKGFGILFVLVGLVLAGSLKATVVYSLGGVVLDGGTGENTYVVQNGASSALAYNSGTPSLTFTLNTSGNFSYLIGYFASQSLSNVGDSIALSYQFAPSGATTFSSVDEGLRIGLFNSTGTGLAANAAGTGAAVLNNDVGYLGSYRPRGTPVGSGNSLQQRSSGNDLLWASATRVAVSGSPTLSSPGTGSVTGSLTLTLVSTGIQIDSALNGGSIESVIDTSGLVTSFDSFSIFAFSGGTNPTLTFSELTVSFNTIPEPSTCAFLGIFCFLFLLKSSRIAAIDLKLRG